MQVAQPVTSGDFTQRRPTARPALAHAGIGVATAKFHEGSRAVIVAGTEENSWE